MTGPVEITLTIGGQPLVAELDEVALAEIAAAVVPDAGNEGSA